MANTMASIGGAMDGQSSTPGLTVIELMGNKNANESILPPMITSNYYDESGSWMFSSRDIPILIGAAAGAIGLILIFLAAALIWHCCQFALQREKSSYSLESDSEKNSVTSPRGSNNHFYINNPIDSTLMSDEKCVPRDTSDQNLKRSLSAPIHRDNCALKSNTQTSVTKSAHERPSHGRQLNASAVDIEDTIEDTIDDNADSVSIGVELDNKNEINSQRSHMYATNHHHLSGDMSALKSKSLPWSQSNKRRTVTIDDENDELAAKINFSKKRKNRMRNDSAAAIAMNRSGGTDTKAKTLYSHKDTDTLVDNEAIVVYDERTAL